MKRSLTRAANSPTGTRPSDAASPAGSLALALARAGTASGTSRSRLRSVLGELGASLAASLIACYIADAGTTPRCVALVAMDHVATGQVATDQAAMRERGALARRAAAMAATTSGATQKAPRRGHHLVEPQSSAPPLESLSVLPLETNSRWLGLVVVWPDEERAQVHADVLVQVCPLLGVLIPPLVQPTPRRARAETRSRVARRNTTPVSRTIDSPDAYIAALAHELRNPLNTLVGFLEIVLSGQVGPLNVRQREFLEYARESAGRIASVIEQARSGGDNCER